MQAQQLLQQQYPGMEVVGSTYPVPALKQTLAQLISGLQMALLGLIFFGPKIFETLGYPEPPALYNRVAQNKFGAAMMVWLLGGMLYNQLMSTGAFEIFYNGKLVSVSATKPSTSYAALSTVMCATLIWAYCCC